MNSYEKTYLCGIQNNCVASSFFFRTVVICLKNRTFAVYKTTRVGNYWRAKKLWFAWKIVPLRYTKQRQSSQAYLLSCCDLLEKSYLCGIQNNILARKIFRTGVVICLKNRTFAVYKTTSARFFCACDKLWFAWKIVPLRYTKQQCKT